jgi:hypothetical protein
MGHRSAKGVFEQRFDCREAGTGMQYPTPGDNHLVVDGART